MERSALSWLWQPDAGAAAVGWQITQQLPVLADVPSMKQLHMVSVHAITPSPSTHFHLAHCEASTQCLPHHVYANAAMQMLQSKCCLPSPCPFHAGDSFELGCHLPSQAKELQRSLL